MINIQQAQSAVIKKEALLDYLNGLQVTAETGRNLGNWLLMSRGKTGRLLTHSSASGHAELLHFSRSEQFGAMAYYFPHHSSADEEGVRYTYLAAMESINSAITFSQTSLGSQTWAESSYHEALSALATTEENWDDCGSRGPSAAAMGTTEAIAKRFYERGVPDLAFYPAPDGGVDVQWRTSTSLLIVEILSDGKVSAVRRVSGNGV